MNYARPMLRSIDLNVDVAGCRECERGFQIAPGLCFATRTVIVVNAGGESVTINPGQLPVPGLPGVDGLPLLP